ncbi:MAG: hypothetical protein K2P57_13320 [Burkholderiales bacterium]|nr:hypothetical protein [Burkholderiales bacterium]
MDRNIGNIVGKIRALEAELEQELAKRGEDLRFSIENRKIRFENGVLAEHKKLKVALLSYLAHARLRHILVAPIVYSLILPFLLLDSFVSLYQAICFPVYRIPKVSRCDHIVFDRHNLAYLNIIEKANCAYCSYGNGLISYVREIAARTEQYWCPIKHARRISGGHSRYRRFVDFGDAKSYRDSLEKLRGDYGEKE